MEISIFDVIGPVMIGPSSSHTAGAARLARAARSIVKGTITHVSFGLHGSFAQTYKGHGTDRALLAGVLGLSEQDERLSDAFSLAKQAGLTWNFYPIQLEGVHENTVKITMKKADGSQTEVIGSSVGGGQILICSVNGFETDMTLSGPTLLLLHYDHPGIISEVTRIIAEYGINIATMKLSRKGKGQVACCVIEADGRIPDTVAEEMKRRNDVITAQVISLDENLETRAR